MSLEWYYRDNEKPLGGTLAFINLLFFIAAASTSVSILSFLLLAYRSWSFYKRSITPGSESGQYVVDDDGVTYHLLYGEDSSLVKGHAVGEKPKHKHQLAEGEALPDFAVTVGEDGEASYVGLTDDDVAIPLERILKRDDGDTKVRLTIG